MNEMSLFEANRPRAQMIAAMCAERLPEPGLWAGYTAQERLVGELRRVDQINYWRASAPQAVVVMWNPVMNDLKEVDWGEEQIIESNVIERYASTILLEKPIVYKESVSHTFSKTRTLLEQAKVGAEAAVKASVGAEYAGAKGSLEVSAKIYAEYQRQWGEEAHVSDTVSRDIEVQGPITLSYEAERAVNKTQRLITARTDFTYAIGLIDETGAGVNPPRIYHTWQSWQEFLAVVKGLAPRTRADRNGNPQDVPMYHEFLNRPLQAHQLDQLERPTDGEISFLVEYDNVLHQDIKVI